MKYHQADFVGLAESNLNWRHDQVYRETEYVIRDHHKDTRIEATCAETTVRNNTYQPGSVLSWVKKPWSGRTTTNTDTSGLGRWTETTMIGKLDRTVTIFTVYRPCKDDIRKAGPSKVYMQQWQLLRQKNIINPDPRQQLLVDLKTRINQLKDAEHEIIVMMDANEDCETANSFTDWICEIELIDIYKMRHGLEHEPETQQSGSKRIDFFSNTSVA